MQELNEIASKLGTTSNLREIRRSIAKLMLDHLQALLATPTHWENAHFANAVAALGMNIHAVQQPTQSWLRLCILDLQKAIESIQPNVPYLAYDRHRDVVTIEEMIMTIETLDAHAEWLASADSGVPDIGAATR